MQEIHFVLLPNMLASSVTLPMEMLKGGENYARVINRRAEQLNIRLVAQSMAPVMTRSGIMLSPDIDLAETSTADLILLPALWRNPIRVLEKSQPLLPWLNRQHENGAIISAVGTGVCFLAEAGLLDNKAATTHWHYFDAFQSRYPNVLLKRQYFITQSGNLYCAASVNSLADLVVHFLQRLYGNQVASHIERHFSHEIRRSYESSGFFEGETNRHPDEDIVQAQMWLQDNYNKEVRLSDVASRFEMSVRSFNRRFKAATGMSPLQYLQHVRIQIAKDLLKTSNLTISEIAFNVGYTDMGHFTALFKKLLTTTPSDYRTTVRGKLFNADT